MDQQVPTQLNSKVSTFCESLEHESQDRNKERSRRLRRVSQRFLNIYKNSEMSHIDRQVKKLSAMANMSEPDGEAANTLIEEDPVLYVDETSSSNHEVQTFPVDNHTSCSSSNVTGEIVHQLSTIKEEPSSTPHCHFRQSYTRHSGNIMSVFKGRRGRPPKPLWVKIPRLSVTTGTATNVGSSLPIEMNVEKGAEVSEASSVAQQVFPAYSAFDNTNTTFANLKPLACASSGDLHSDNHKLRSKPPSKKRRIVELEDTASNHSHSLRSSITSGFDYACNGVGDSHRGCCTSELPLCMPLLTGEEHCSETEEEGLPTVSGVVETAIIVAGSSPQGRIEENTFPSFIQCGPIQNAHHAVSFSTAEKEFTEVCLSSNTQNSALQPAVTCSVAAEQDPWFSSLDATSTASDGLSVSIPKETLGTIWGALSANPPIVAEDKDVQESLISNAKCLVLDKVPEKNSSSPLATSVPVASIHSPPCCHTAKESNGSDISSSVDTAIVEASDISECTALPSDVGSSGFPSSFDNSSLLSMCQNHNSSKCSGSNKTCDPQTSDGQYWSSNMVVDASVRPAVFTAKVEMSNQVPLVECSGVQEAVDGNEGTLSNIVGGIQASKDSSYNRCDEAESDCCAEVLAMPDSGRCSPCLSHLPKEYNSGSHLHTDDMKVIAGWIPCNSTKDDTNQQKYCQPWEPASEAVHAEQEAVRMVIHEAAETSMAVLPDGEQCSSLSTTSAGENCKHLPLDGSCVTALCESMSEHAMIASEIASGVTTVEGPKCVHHRSVEAIHEFVEGGDSTLLIANEVLNSSGEANIEEREVLIEEPKKPDPLSSDDRQEIVAKRPQREQARRRRNEKAFLYDENLVDLILAEHEALLPVSKGRSKPIKGDKASTEPAKTYLRHRRITKASKQKDVNASSSVAQSKGIQLITEKIPHASSASFHSSPLSSPPTYGSSSKLPHVPKQKDSWIENGSLLLKKQKLVAVANSKLKSGQVSKNKAPRGVRTQEKTRTKYSNNSKERVAAVKGSTSPVKLVIPKVPSWSKGRRSAVSSLLDTDVDRVRVTPQLTKEGKQPADVVAGEYLEKSALEPPPPRSKNYWRTAQAWLPRKVPRTHEEVVALREESLSMKTQVASKSHLEENNGWKWLGDPISVSKYASNGKQVIRSYFIGMRRGRKQTEDILARDCVLVFSGDSSKFPYVGRIVSFWQDSGSDEMMFTTAWYHRPVDVLGSKLAENYSDRELFASSHQDDNPVASILCKCFVMGYNEYCRFRGMYCCLQSMVKSPVSDVLVPNPSPHQLVNFHIPVANSKVDLSHVFYCKNSLVSARHHTNRMKTDQRMRLKYMQKGVKPHHH